MNRTMTIIITMAGLGLRFRKAGYHCPKYMIEARGKTLFEWSMDSLKGYDAYVLKYVFVVRKEDNAVDFIEKKCEKYGISNIELLELNDKTDGQATTCALAIPYCSQDSGIMVYNIDTYVEPYELKYEDVLGDGYIPCFHARGDHWSFVKVDKNNQVVEVREKERISNNCTLGAYFFKSPNLYKELYEEYYGDINWADSMEKYIAPLYNCMLDKGMNVSYSVVNEKKVHVLGTPEELNTFLQQCV